MASVAKESLQVYDSGLDVEQQLACDIIRSHFGDLVERVVFVLLQAGKLSARQIQQRTELDAETVRKCLCVLIQHWIVVSEEVPEAFFEASLRQILIRLRFPRFLLQIHTLFGELGEQIVQIVLENGIVTLEQVIQILHEQLPQSAATQQPTQIKTLFGRIVSDGFLINAKQALHPGISHSPTTQYIHKSQPLSGSRRGGKSKQEEQISDTLDSVSGKRRLEEHALKPKSKRAKVFCKAEVHEDPTPDASNITRKASVMVIDEQKQFWRVDYQCFIASARRDACVEVVRDRIDSFAAALFQVMLKSSGDGKEPVYFNAIQQELANMSAMELKNLPATNLMNYLDVMCEDSIHMISREILPSVARMASSVAFSINLDNVVSHIRQKTVESIIKDKFGARSYRIFRLLMMLKQVENKQIAEAAMIPAKEVRQRLYQMFKSDYIHLQEVSKGSDRAPSRTFYLWSVKFAHTLNLLISEVCRALFNVRRRLDLENKRMPDLPSKVDEETGNYQSPLPDDPESLQVGQLRRKQQLLEASALQLDELLEQLRDF